VLDAGEALSYRRGRGVACPDRKEERDMASEELLTAGKLAEQLGVPVAKVNKYIKDNGVEPDKTKGACKYYGPAKQKVIAKGTK
jgi:hypothetical protein